MDRMQTQKEKTELFFGLVAPVGVDVSVIENPIGDYLKQFGYKVVPRRLSSLIKRISGLQTTLMEDTEFNRTNSYMTAGNEARKIAERGDILAGLAICEIHRMRQIPIACNAYIFRTLKHPDEVDLLRDIYGDGFFLLGISSSYRKRLKYLKDVKGMTEEEAKALIQRDESEELEFGQHTRDVFHLADGFIDIDSADAAEQIARTIDLIFGTPYVTPTKDEYAMFLAFSASLRSADLSRQIGAVISSEDGDIVSTGANDVPRFGGGLYWPENGNKDFRDYRREGYDSNEMRRNEIIIKIMKKIDSANQNNKNKLLEKGIELLKDTGILDITEYGRAVHAEMEALLSCARSGVSTKGSTLYSTTFPCHNCAKHIVAAGISRVVFVEPYPKSLALDLHSDSIILERETEDDDVNKKVQFQPFVGIGPRRFVDLFSIHLSRGKKIKRKIASKAVDWERSSASVRLPLLSISYIDREKVVANEIYNKIGEEDHATVKK